MKSDFILHFYNKLQLTQTVLFYLNSRLNFSYTHTRPYIHAYILITVVYRMYIGFKITNHKFG